MIMKRFTLQSGEIREGSTTAIIRLMRVHLMTHNETSGRVGELKEIL